MTLYTDLATANPTAYILADFPEGYRLFEHIKTRKDAASGETAKKGHAGGGHDRQDAYLYGHPEGRKKRFRSPAEFFYHLKYLLDPECKDWRDCACKFCAPDELQPSKGRSVKRDAKASDKSGSAKAEKKKAAETAQVIMPVKSTAPTVKAPQPQVQPKQQLQRTQIAVVPVPVPSPAPAPVPVLTPALQPVPTPVSQPRHIQPVMQSSAQPQQYFMNTFQAAPQANRYPTLAPSPISSTSRSTSATPQNKPGAPVLAPSPQLIMPSQASNTSQAHQQYQARPPVAPQWMQAPAHPSHLIEYLDQSTVDWIQSERPHEFQMWQAWLMARFPSQQEKDDLHRALIDSLDYLVWQGFKIPGYFPRKVSRIGPDGKMAISSNPNSMLCLPPLETLTDTE
jgi:Transcription-silencing protein, cryptic loci regulator Clr2